MNKVKTTFNTITSFIVMGLVMVCVLCIGVTLMPNASASEDKELVHAEKAQTIADGTEELKTLNIEKNYAERILDNKITQIRAKELELQAAKEGLYLFEMEYCSEKLDHPDLYSDVEKGNCEKKLNDSGMTDFM